MNSLNINTYESSLKNTNTTYSLAQPLDQKIKRLVVGLTIGSAGGSLVCGAGIALLVTSLLCPPVAIVAIAVGAAALLALGIAALCIYLKNNSSSIPPPVQPSLLQAPPVVNSQPHLPAPALVLPSPVLSPPIAFAPAVTIPSIVSPRPPQEVPVSTLSLPLPAAAQVNSSPAAPLPVQSAVPTVVLPIPEPDAITKTREALIKFLKNPHDRTDNCQPQALSALNECGCASSGDISRDVDEFILKNTSPVLKNRKFTYVSVGAGGGLQDWVILAKLIMNGFRNIEVHLVDIGYPDPDYPPPGAHVMNLYREWQKMRDQMESTLKILGAQDLTISCHNSVNRMDDVMLRRKWHHEMHKNLDASETIDILLALDIPSYIIKHRSQASEKEIQAYEDRIKKHNIARLPNDQIKVYIEINDIVLPLERWLKPNNDDRSHVFYYHTTPKLRNKNFYDYRDLQARAFQRKLDRDLQARAFQRKLA